MLSWLLHPQRVSVRNLPTYVITPDNNDAKWVRRRNNVFEIFQRRKFKDFTFVRGATGPDSVEACTTSHAYAVLQALKRKPFKPFLLLEDDARDELQSPLHFDMPKDADAMYLGISHGGVDMAPSEDAPYIHLWNGNYYTLTDDPYVLRIYNMLSTHAVVINTERFARNWLLAANESLCRKIPIDVILGLTHSDFNVYAQRYGMFYQANKLGGCEETTRGPFGGRSVNSKGQFLSLTHYTRPLCYTHMMNNPHIQERYSEQQKKVRQAELCNAATSESANDQADGTP